MRAQRKQKIPLFKTEDEERAFWGTHDSTEYFPDTGRFIEFPNLKPRTRLISIRLPLSLISAVKREANKRDVPYQSLMKIILSQGLKTLH